MLGFVEVGRLGRCYQAGKKPHKKAHPWETPHQGGPRDYEKPDAMGFYSARESNLGGGGLLIWRAVGVQPSPYLGPIRTRCREGAGLLLGGLGILSIHLT